MRHPIAVAALVGFAVLSGLGSVSSAHACTWSMGWEDWSPYQFEQDGKLTGLDIDMINAIAAEAGCTVSHRQLPWARHIDLVARGTVDIAAGASLTDDRAAFAHFSQPYRSEAVALLTRDDADYADLEALLTSGGKIGIVIEFEYGERIDKLLSKLEYGKQISAVTSDATNYRKLLGGRIDGMLLDPYSAGVLKAELGGGTKIAATLAESPIHVMFSKKSVSEALVDKFNRALAALRKNGTHTQIISQYTGN